ncbi:MAG: hypothetical protein EBZ59_03985 [Planctomycetia bacterium]|nr:hypothetical protein [Planctomycetia bacterium]
MTAPSCARRRPCPRRPRPPPCRCRRSSTTNGRWPRRGCCGPSSPSPVATRFPNTSTPACSPRGRAVWRRPIGGSTGWSATICGGAARRHDHLARRERNRLAYATRGKPRPEAVFWPNPTSPQCGRSIHDERPFVSRVPLVDRTTPIVSVGSCFAMEIAHALQRDGFTYVVKEPNACPRGTYVVKDRESSPPIASAAWGIIFNTPSFAQLAERAFGLRRPSNLLFSTQYRGGGWYCDPMREEVLFPSPEAFAANQEPHLRAAREAFLEARVLVITLGLNEVWYFKPDEAAFSRSPWRTAPSLVEARILTVEENVAALQRMLDVLRAFNPGLHVVVTLSPIPLHATVRGDSSHVITANAHSKAVQRVAIEEFVGRNRGVHYFPSHELVSHCIRDPWAADQRHVSRETVDRVMALFYEMFVADAVSDARFLSPEPSPLRRAS